MEESQKNSKKILIIVVIIVLILAAGSFIFFSGNKEEKNIKNNETNSTIPVKNQIETVNNTDIGETFGVAIRDFDIMKDVSISTTMGGDTSLEGNSIKYGKLYKISISRLTNTIGYKFSFVKYGENNEIREDGYAPKYKIIEEEVIEEKNISADGVKIIKSECLDENCLIYYINEKNELFYFEVKDPNKNKNTFEIEKLKDDVIGIGSLHNNIYYNSPYMYPSFVVKNSDGSYNAIYMDKIFKIDDVQRQFIKVGYDYNKNEKDTSKVLYMANPSARINHFLTNDKGEMLYGKTVIECANDKDTYVIGEDNLLYCFENFSNKENGKLYSKSEVKSYSIISHETGYNVLRITFKDGKYLDINISGYREKSTLGN